MDATIIIVSWNAKKHLVNCLNSLSQSSGHTQEIIVVDNGSTDGSPKAVEEQFPQVRLIRNNENLGFAKANNIGIRESKGRYVCFVNPDVIVHDACIEKLIEFMDKNPSVGMSAPKILNPDGTLQVSCRHFPSIWNNLCQAIGLNKLFPKSVFFSEPQMKYWAHNETRIVDVLSGCFWMVRREALDKVGLLDEDFFIYAEDIDWCRRFHNAGWDVVFYPQAEAVHFHGASSSNAPIRFNLEMQKADLQYWRKHHGRKGQLAYWMTVLVRQLVRIPVLFFMYVFRLRNRQTMRFKLRKALACVQFLFGFNVEK